MAHSAAAAASFVLDPSLTQVQNPNAPELDIKLASGTAVDNHTGQYGGAGNGGDWTTSYTFSVPSALTPGQDAVISLGLSVSTPGSGPLFIQMTALAPNFAQALSINYPTTASASKQYTIPIAADSTSAPELTITIGVLSANVIYHYRPGAAVTPPPAATPPPVVVPTPSGFDQTVTVPEPPPGGAALLTSPSLAALGGVVAPSAMSVDISGLSVRDQVIAARLRCFINFTKAAFNFVNTIGQTNTPLAVFEQTYNADDRAFIATFAVNHLLIELGQCVALVDAVAAFLATPTHSGVARTAAASCAMTPVALSLSGSGSKTRLRSFKMGGAAAKNTGLRVSCIRRSGGVTISVATRSKSIPLSKVVGPRLTFGLVRSRNDTPGGQLSVAFHHP